MSKRRRKEAPMPASALGLLMFFEKETSKIKLKPWQVLLLSIGFLLISGILIIAPVIP